MSTNFLTAQFDDEDESGDDFNPQAEQGSEGGDESEDGNPARRPSSDDEEQRRSSRSPPTDANGDPSPRPTNPRRRITLEDAEEAIGDDEEEQDPGEDDEGEGEDLGDEDEDEDDDDDDIVGRQTKRQKRKGRRGNQFIEEEAEVDDDDDDVDADEDELGGDFVQEQHPDDDLPAEADTDDRRHRELDRKRQLEASMDAEKQAQEFKERYGRRTTTALSNSAFVPQNLLMPDVNTDPRIWGIKCREGKEKEIIRKLMQKMEDMRGSRKPLRLCSVFERGEGSMRGYIFVEAKEKSHVDDALDGVNDVYPRSKANLVPIKEMPDLLRVTKSKELSPGDYVRIKKGVYTGDLAIVEDVVANGLDVTVKVVPRLTYGAEEDDARNASDPKRKRGFGNAANPITRPPARLFNENEAKKRHARFLQSNRGLTGNSFTYRGEIYEDGFLIKDFRLQHLTTENVQPKLEETQMFTKTGQDGSETLDLETLKKSLHDNTSAESNYQVGDEVEVFAGEQKGIVGRTERTSGNIVSIKVSEGDLAGQIVEVPVRSLRKRFREGDNVIVVGGSKYRDQVGTVLLIKDEKVTILTQDSQTEITVFSRDLREASGVAASSERSKFDVRDLVQLTATSFGCVVSASPQNVMVMDTTGEVFPKAPSAISKIDLPRRQVSVDRNGQEIKVGDAVKEIAGENHAGNIIHIYRNFLYGVDRSRMVEHAGIWVARCSGVVSRGAKAGPGAGIDMSKINPALKTGVANGGAMLPPQRPGPDRLLRQRVKIRQGMYKGHRGIVKDSTAGEARVELESKNKVVNIPKDQLGIIDPRNPDQATPYAEWARMRGGPPRMATGGSRVPDAGSRIPDGGRTPAWGASSRTPAWGGVGSGTAMDGGRTPGWQRPSGSTTSYGGAGNMTSYGGAGNMTSYGGAGNSTSYGSRTPTWSTNAKTPYAGDSGFASGSRGAENSFDAFVSGSRTPAHQSSGSSRTPAWSGPGAASAPTPAARGYDAPTPAASAPTPGAGFNDDAYTPAYTAAPTPGAFGSNDRGPIDAPTPGGFGGGEVSRMPGYAKGANKDPLKYNRLMDAPTPAASAPTPFAMDAPTPAAGGPQYAEDDDDD